jgi:hypothetical protein
MATFDTPSTTRSHGPHRVILATVCSATLAAAALAGVTWLSTHDATAPPSATQDAAATSAHTPSPATTRPADPAPEAWIVTQPQVEAIQAALTDVNAHRATLGLAPLDAHIVVADAGDDAEPKPDLAMGFGSLQLTDRPHLIIHDLRHR